MPDCAVFAIAKYRYTSTALKQYKLFFSCWCEILLFLSLVGLTLLLKQKLRRTGQTYCIWTRVYWQWYLLMVSVGIAVLADTCTSIFGQYQYRRYWYWYLNNTTCYFPMCVNKAIETLVILMCYLCVAQWLLVVIHHQRWCTFIKFQTLLQANTVLLMPKCT